MKVKSLDKALYLLHLFTVARPQWSLTQLSRAANLPLSTTHRIANSLKDHGLLARDPQSREFRLGFGAIDLGHRALASMDISLIAKPIMRRLARQTRETILLTVPNDTRDHSVCIERIDGQYDLRIHLEVGRQVPLHAGASAKVLLAYFPPDEIDELLRRVGLPRVASNTIEDPEILREHLAEIRHQGYAVSQEETNEGAWGLAVPILDQRGHCVAGLGVSLPISRYSPEAEERFAELAQDAAKETGAAMGLEYG
jgi:IclR family KDG regulon transcriptional repressor